MTIEYLHQQANLEGFAFKVGWDRRHGWTVHLFGGPYDCAKVTASELSRAIESVLRKKR